MRGIWRKGGSGKRDMHLSWLPHGVRWRVGWGCKKPHRVISILSGLVNGGVPSRSRSSAVARGEKAKGVAWKGCISFGVSVTQKRNEHRNSHLEEEFKVENEEEEEDEEAEEAEEAEEDDDVDNEILHESKIWKSPLVGSTTLT